MTAHEIHALSGAYAVDALDDLERARFEEHLAACADCQAEVTSLQDATLLLSQLSETAPPESLRAKVLADITTVRPLPPVVARLERSRPRRWRNLVAAAAVLGVLGGGAIAVQQVVQDDSSQLPPVSRVLTAADVEHVNLDFRSGASATVYRSASEGKAVLVARKMQPAPSGRVYQLWLQDARGTMISAGLMHGGAENSTVLLQGDANDATGVGITIEPEGGSTEPTTEPIALFDFERAT